MRKLKARVLAIPLVLMAVTASFQNCSAGFMYDPATGALSSASNDLTGVFGMRLYAAGGFVVADSMPLTPGVAYEMRATGQNTGAGLLDMVVDNSASSASCILSATGSLTRRELKCTTSGTVKVDLTAYWEDGTSSFVTHSHVVGAATSTPPPGTIDENTVLFTIVNGTGPGAWNMLSTQILVYVGQTLRVVNNDTVNHRIQTNGNPFVTQMDQIAPNGGIKEFPVTSAIATGNTTTFDGISGANARIFIESIDGDAKYAQANGPGSCASCHSGVANSTKRGSSFSAIKTAITSNRGNMGGITLSDKDLRAIAYALNH